MVRRFRKAKQRNDGVWQRYWYVIFRRFRNPVEERALVPIGSARTIGEGVPLPKKRPFKEVSGKWEKKFSKYKEYFDTIEDNPDQLAKELAEAVKHEDRARKITEKIIAGRIPSGEDAERLASRLRGLQFQMEYEDKIQNLLKDKISGWDKIKQEKKTDDFKESMKEKLGKGPVFTPDEIISPRAWEKAEQRRQLFEEIKKANNLKEKQIDITDKKFGEYIKKLKKHVKEHKEFERKEKEAGRRFKIREEEKVFRERAIRRRAEIEAEEVSRSARRKAYFAGLRELEGELRAGKISRSEFNVFRNTLVRKYGIGR